MQSKDRREVLGAEQPQVMCENSLRGPPAGRGQVSLGAPWGPEPTPASSFPSVTGGGVRPQ